MRKHLGNSRKNKFLVAGVLVFFLVWFGFWVVFFFCLNCLWCFLVFACSGTLGYGRFSTRQSPSALRAMPSAIARK